MNIFSYFAIFRQKELSPNNVGIYSVNSHGYVDLSGQIIDVHKSIRRFIKCDFSNSSFIISNTIYWIKNKTFIESTFSRTTFNALAEHGNKFCNCIFEDINFKNAILGYDSSCYTNCTFRRVKFGAFIKPQFKDCKFVDCDFYNVDLQASSFEHCEFVGKLENVWFRGGFPTDSLKKEFGYAKQNRMLNVSFENAILKDITFSDNCDLSTIILPKQGQYLFFDNWNEQLNMILAKGTTNQPVKTNKKITSFVAIYKVHSANQKYYILNMEDLLREYSEKAVEIIRQNATQKAEINMCDKYCKVCGFKLRFSPWGEDNNSPTYEICPCCGAEFGYDDYTSQSIKAYREKWIKSGAKWFNPEMKPDNWNLEKQLHNRINIAIDNKLSNKDLAVMSNWKSKQQIFFLTKLDIINMMSIVERKIPIEYVLMGAFDSEVVRRESTISKFTKLGHTDYGNWISLDNRYMVLPLNDEVKYRIVKQRDGSHHYIIDLSSNPTGVELSTGGVYDKAERVLIAGRIAVFTDSSSESMLIYKEILKAMNKCFAKKNNIFISQKALSLLEDGWRLTCNFNASSCENDFK